MLINRKNKIPGQALISQSAVSSSAPEQSVPLYWGGGLVHERVLVVIPMLQVTEHAAQSPHSVQLPSTAKHKLKVTCSQDGYTPTSTEQVKLGK